MCHSKADGGKRCEYADMVANVRRKARYKHRNNRILVEKKAEEAVQAWKEANPDIVRKHLPAKMPFQYRPVAPPPVPQELLNMLTPSSRASVSGCSSTEDYRTMVKTLFESNCEWQERLNDDEKKAVRQYSVNAYTTMNALLRKKGFNALMKIDYGAMGVDVDEMREQAQKRINDLKSAMKKSTLTEKPRKLYRFFRVPSGVTAVEYVERYMSTGEGFRDGAFMSTSADPEYVMAHIDDRRKNGKADKNRYVVMEILTKQGQSLQNDEEPTPGDVQSLENEVLLPAGTKLRVVGFNKSQRFEYSRERRDLFDHYSETGRIDYEFSTKGHHSQGDRLNIPMVQLIDEKLITEYDKKKTDQML